MTNIISSTAALETVRDNTHKFIRTVNVKFQVQDVVSTTYEIEHAVKQHNGFVIFTELTTRVNKQLSIPIHKDSIHEATYYTMVNDMVLRVLNISLDTFLKQIAYHVDALDYRIIKADDIALELLANKHSLVCNEAAIARLSKLTKQQESVDLAIADKQTQADNALVSNALLKDQLNYATIELHIYQRQQVKLINPPNNDAKVAAGVGLGTKMTESFRIGLYVMEWFFY
jgi:translation elongation factor EF-Ts